MSIPKLQYQSGEAFSLASLLESRVTVQGYPLENNNTDFGASQTWVQISTLPFTSCVPLDESFSLGALVCKQTATYHIE